ncbi:AI-2E family transporter [Aureimonas ureilytica]|uniref:AI-2E family transporter n=1 Tax=Aureimonas ureilytica TaxID=401562 RepID=UPI003CF9D61A
MSDGDLTSKREATTVVSPNIGLVNRQTIQIGPRWAVIGIFLILFFGALYLARDFVLPVVFAILFMLVLSPIVRIGKRRLGLWEPLTAAALVFGTSLLVLGSFYAFSGPIAQIAENTPRYVEAVNKEVTVLRERFMTVREARQQAREATNGEGAVSRPEDVIISGPSLLGNMAAVVPRIGASIGFALIFLFLLLSSGNLFYRKTVETLPSLSDKKRALSIAFEIETELSRYLFTITAINMALGIAIGSAMALIGMPMPGVFGALAFVFNFIPYLGAVFGIGLVALVGLTEFGSLSSALVPPLVYLAITSLEGQFITPILVGRRLRMNSAAVFLSVAFWGWIWGIVGMFLAVPLMVCIKIIASYFDGLQAFVGFLAADEAEDTPPADGGN